MTEELQELEPADEPATTADGIAPNGDVPVVARPSGGILGAPAFNPAADKEYYRFLFAGVVLFALSAAMVVRRTGRGAVPKAEKSDFEPTSTTSVSVIDLTEVAEEEAEAEAEADAEARFDRAD